MSALNDSMVFRMVDIAYGKPEAAGGGSAAMYASTAACTWPNCSSAFNRLVSKVLPLITWFICENASKKLVLELATSVSRVSMKATHRESDLDFSSLSALVDLAVLASCRAVRILAVSACFWSTQCCQSCGKSPLVLPAKSKACVLPTPVATAFKMPTPPARCPARAFETDPAVAEGAPRLCNDAAEEEAVTRFGEPRAPMLTAPSRL
mmetsp:Transcript_99001/g.194456  ORF Transcript_99001/g.194456 Transcript_99001/m.194456 type:complete len:208 (+) Transcript_99001:280-903(+)